MNCPKQLSWVARCCLAAGIALLFAVLVAPVASAAAGQAELSHRTSGSPGSARLRGPASSAAVHLRFDDDALRVNRATPAGAAVTALRPTVRPTLGLVRTDFRTELLKSAELF